MQVGDLVTLSAAGKKIEEIRLTHRRWFKANASKYGRMTKAEQISWLDYWENDKMLGMIQRVEKKYRRLWNYEEGRWQVLPARADHQPGAGKLHGARLNRRRAQAHARAARGGREEPLLGVGWIRLDPHTALYFARRGPPSLR